MKEQDLYQGRWVKLSELERDCLPARKAQIRGMMESEKLAGQYNLGGELLVRFPKRREVKHET